LKYSTVKPVERAGRYGWFQAVSLAVREFMIDGMLATEERCRKSDAKRLYYLSIEFLMGRTLGNTLHNLNLYDLCKEALIEMGADLEEIQEIETDAALGNGGLGRLAACFLDSLASQDLPGYGYGINYEFGLFKQQIINGHQREKPDYWSGKSSPWPFTAGLNMPPTNGGNTTPCGWTGSCWSVSPTTCRWWDTAAGP